MNDVQSIPISIHKKDASFITESVYINTASLLKLDSNDFLVNFVNGCHVDNVQTIPTNSTFHQNGISIIAYFDMGTLYLFPFHGAQIE